MEYDIIPLKMIISLIHSMTMTMIFFLLHIQNLVHYVVFLLLKLEI